MLSKLTHITIFVANQEEALDFYTQKLQFKVHTDAMFGPGLRWLTVAPTKHPDMELSLFLADTPEEKALVGKQSAKKPLLAFACEDIHKTYDTFKTNGVKIVSAPTTASWGISMAIEDLYGNVLYIVQS